MKYIPLVQVCDFQGGSQPPKDQWICYEKEGYIRMLQIRDFTQPNKDNVEFVRISKTIKTCNEDDILIGRYGASVGKILTGLAGAYNVAIIKTIPDTSKLSKRFLYHYLNSPYFQNFILSVGSRAAQAGFNKDDLSDAQIPDLSLEEQSNVVSQLDKVTEMITLRKEQLAKLDELVKSRFVELFIGKGYPVTSIKELLVQNSTVEKISNTKIEKFVTVGIKGKGAREREIKDGKWPVPFSGYRVKEGQFIYSRIDARNGAFAILPKEVDGAVVSKDFPVFEIKADKMLPNVLLFSVLQDDFVRQIQNSSFGATNRQRIQEEVFGEYTITLPPMEIQNQFAAFVEQTDKSKLAIQESLAELETLKKALMQKYFG